MYFIAHYFKIWISIFQLSLFIQGNKKSCYAILLLSALFITTCVTANENLLPSNLAKQPIAQKLLVIGDSLSAGYGFAKKDGWVELLKSRLSNSSYHIEVFNASVSGETTYGGLTRTANLLKKYQPHIVIVELGGNDGLQGLGMPNMEKNLDEMVSLLRQKNVRVLLLGMKLPPNYGQYYTNKFESVYRRIANKYAVDLMPFMLKNIATSPELMQQDGIHPRADAQQIILNNIWPFLRKLLSKNIAK